MVQDLNDRFAIHPATRHWILRPPSSTNRTTLVRCRRRQPPAVTTERAIAGDAVRRVIAQAA